MNKWQTWEDMQKHITRYVISGSNQLPALVSRHQRNQVRIQDYFTRNIEIYPNFKKNHRKPQTQETKKEIDDKQLKIS